MVCRTVLFDLDGTLLDTLDDLTDSVNYALTRLDFPPRERDEVRRFVGNGVGKLIERAVPPTGRDRADECLRLFRDHYRANMQNKTKPYPGIAALLRALKARGVRVGVVSNKFDGAVKPLCAGYFGELIDCAVGEREGLRRKPWPDTVLAAMRELAAEKTSTLYVGDSPTDVETADNSGLKCLGVSWGFRTRAQLEQAGADRVIDAPEEFLEAMDGIFAGDTNA